MSEAATPPTQSLPFSTAGDSGDWVEVRGLSDATVEVKGPFSAKELSQPVNSTFWITYYDMPLLETVRGANGDRISFGIVNYVSPLICRLLKSDESLTASERRDLAERCKDFEQKSCEWAQVAVTVLPRDFIASRDRPYLDQLAKRQRESGIYVFVTGLLIGAFALLAVLAYLLWRRLAPRFKSRLQ
jgi:hypothetical protein